MQPIVVIVADIREFDGETWHCVPDQYLKAACKVADVLPLFLPALGSDIDVDDLLGRVDGVMLSGSKANVHHFGLVVDDKNAVRQTLEDMGVEIVSDRFLDFYDPWGNQIEIVGYQGIQFTKAEHILCGKDLEELDKTDKAIEELVAKGVKPEG